MSETKIYNGTDQLDFTGLVNVKRQITDHRDPSIGASNKSYTIDIPLTPSNVIILKFINDIRSREVVSGISRILTNGIELIQGKMRILSNSSLYAKIIVEADDWVNGISDVSIKSLSWVGGDEHTYSSANISGSWVAAAGAFYRYALINFGKLISGDSVGTDSKVYPYDFYPMWNVEDIVTKALLDTGYTVASGGFFAGTFGRSLYVLSEPKPVEDSFISGKAIEANVALDSDNYDNQTGVGAFDPVNLEIDQVLVMTNETIDEGNDFSISTYRYTVPEDGTYRFQSVISITSDPNVGGIAYTGVTNSLTFQVRKNGTPIATLSASGSTEFDPGNSFTVDSGLIHLETSDYIDIYVNAIVTATRGNIPGTVDPELFVIAGTDVSYFEALWSEHNLWPGIGFTMDPANLLPDITGQDFLKGLKAAFNLRFFADRSNKKLYIETSDDFYGDTVIDWSDKIDYSEQIGLDVLASNYRQTQKFLWKPDTSDKAYTFKVSADGIPFMKELTLDNAYAMDGVTENENPEYSPTVLGNMEQIGHWSYTKIPRIYGSGDFPSFSYPDFRAKVWSPRIFSWKGMVALTQGGYDYHTSIMDTSPTSYTTFPSAETPDMNDMYDDYLLKDWRRIEKNKSGSPVLKMSAAEIIQFNTVVGTPENEGFRATYKLNIEGVDMDFLVDKIITDGDRVKAEVVQKL